MIIDCHECGFQVSTEARACMQCGAPPKFTDFAEQEATLNLRSVSFEEARYNVTCSDCGNCVVVRGKSLSTKPHIKCPFCKAAGRDAKITVQSLRKASLREGQVAYRRLTDFYSYFGRVSVADYWLSVLLAIPFLFLLRLIPSPASPLVFFAALHPLWIKRYHDLGLSGGWVSIQAFVALTTSIAALLMPNVLSGQSTYPNFAVIWGLATLAGFVSGIFISFAPGKAKINRYGPPKAEVKRSWC